MLEALPEFTWANTKTPNLVEGLAALHTLKAEMEKVVEETRIKQALKTKLTPAKTFIIKPGDEVPVYREQSKKWKGPFTVPKTSPKFISVTDGTKVRQFNINTVLPISAETNDADHKHDMESLLPVQKNCATTSSYNSIFLTEVLLKADPKYYSGKRRESMKQ